MLAVGAESRWKNGLLKWRKRLAGCDTPRLGPRGIEADDTRLVAAIALLSGLSEGDWDCRRQILVESRIGASDWWVRNWGALRLVVKHVTALVIRRSGQSVIE